MFTKNQSAYQKSFGSAVFSKDRRKCYFDVKARNYDWIPGPGNYRVQSEFGMYNPSDVKGWN